MEIGLGRRGWLGGGVGSGGGRGGRGDGRMRVYIGRRLEGIRGKRGVWVGFAYDSMVRGRLG